MNKPTFIETIQAKQMQGGFMGQPQGYPMGAPGGPQGVNLN